MAPIKTYEVYDKVFAKTKESCYWPAIVLAVDKAKFKSKYKYYLHYYGDNKYGECTPKKMYPYLEYKFIFGKKKPQKYFNKALTEIEEEAENPVIPINFDLIQRKWELNKPRESPALNNKQNKARSLVNVERTQPVVSLEKLTDIQVKKLTTKAEPLKKDLEMEERIKSLAAEYEQKIDKIKNDARNSILLIEKQKDAIINALEKKNMDMTTEMINLQETHAILIEEFKTKMIDLIDIDFECAICKEVAIEVNFTGCMHIFCKLCLERWIKVKKGHECPTCKYKFKNIFNVKKLDSFIKNAYEAVGGDMQQGREALLLERLKDSSNYINGIMHIDLTVLTD